MSITNGFNLTAMQAILPILAMLDGFAIQNEQIKSVEWLDGKVIGLIFPNMSFRVVNTPQQAKRVWLLSNGYALPTAFIEP